MSRYRAEILGSVPHGLTHNDVFASFLSMMREFDPEATVTKTKRGNIISLIVTLEATGVVEARKALHYAQTGITGFSSDVCFFTDLGK